MIAVLDLTIKGSAIVLLAVAILRVWRSRSAAARHAVLASALACAGALPLVGMAVPSWRVETPVPAGMVSATDEAVLHGAVGRAVQPDAVAAAAVVREFVAPVWGGGAALGLFVLLAGLTRLAWIARQAAPLDAGRWHEMAAQLAREYGLARPPRLLQSDRPAVLVTWGLVRPKVLLPAGCAAWADDRVRVVLAHELAHVRRRDWLVQLGAEVLRSVYWFNPLLWIGCARLRRESEQACDDAVLRLGVRGASYAAHLLDLAREFRAHRRVRLPAPAIVRPSALERRVTAMLNVHLDRRPLTPRTAAAIFAAFLGVTASIAGFDAFAQARFATVSGTIVDQSGGVLVDATLVLTNSRTNARNEVRSDRAGFYELVGLPAGEYELEARLMGFAPFNTELRVGVGETLQRNVTLQVGAVQETITMTSGSPASAPAAAPPAARPARRPCPNPSVGGCVGPPLKVTDVRPIYPASLSGAGIEGVVLLETQIGADGKVRDLRVVSSPHPGLERVALDAVAQWEFTPTTLNGRAIDTPMNVSVTFRLSETAAQP